MSTKSDMQYCPECGIKSTAGARVLRGERGTIAALRCELDAALEREAALAAHVEHLDRLRRNVIAAIADDRLEDLDISFYRDDMQPKMHPTTRLARRDLIKQAEGAQMVSEDAKMRIEQANAIYPKFDNSGYRQCIYTADSVAANLRRRAQELSE